MNMYNKRIRQGELMRKETYELQQSVTLEELSKETIDAFLISSEKDKQIYISLRQKIEEAITSREGEKYLTKSTIKLAKKILLLNLLSKPLNGEMRNACYLLNKEYGDMNEWLNLDILDVPDSFIKKSWEKEDWARAIDIEELIDQKKGLIISATKNIECEKGILPKFREPEIDQFRESLRIHSEKKDGRTFLIGKNISILAGGLGSIIYIEEENVYIRGHSHHSNLLLATSIKLNKKIKKHYIKVLQGLTAVCTVRHAPNYAHWTRDVVSKLLEIEEAGILENVKYFLFDLIMKKYQKETLKVMQIKEERIINTLMENQTIFRCSKIILTPKFDKSSAFNRTKLMYQNLAKRTAGTIVTRRPKMLYISRADASYRKVVNEKELIEILYTYGFENLTNSELSLSEQMSLFSEAKVVIGAHSAGLINCLYTKKGLRLIEFHHPDYCRHGSGLTMAQMAYHANYEYYPVECISSIRVSNLITHSAKDQVRMADIQVPIDQVERLLKGIGVKKKINNKQVL